jgi:hypothetical protein
VNEKIHQGRLGQPSNPSDVRVRGCPMSRRLLNDFPIARRCSHHSTILSMLEAVLIRVGRLVHVKSGRQRLCAQYRCDGLRGAKR